MRDNDKRYEYRSVMKIYGFGFATYTVIPPFIIALVFGRIKKFCSILQLLNEFFWILDIFLHFRPFRKTYHSKLSKLIEYICLNSTHAHLESRFSIKTNRGLLYRWHEHQPIDCSEISWHETRRIILMMSLLMLYCTTNVNVIVKNQLMLMGFSILFLSSTHLIRIRIYEKLYSIPVRFFHSLVFVRM